MFIDLHCHLDLLDNPGSAVSNAEKAGLKVILASGISPESNRKVLGLAKGIVKASIGLYPIDAMARETSRNYSPDVESEISFIRRNKDKISSIGEIGLDFKTGQDKMAQESLFRKQLDLAVELGKPVIIHSRKAEPEVLAILKDYKVKAILHCFSGKKQLVHEAMELGCYFTIPTHIVRSEQFQYIAKVVPLSHLFCETDSPFLSPFQDKPNEPAFVVEAYKKVAEINGLELQEATNIIYSNWQRVF